jgi:hypothetical protein
MNRALASILQVFVVVGRPVLVRALATFVAIGLPTAIVFSPSGMRARDLVPAIQHSTILRVVLWAGWLLLAAPSTHAVFEAPGTLTLRALRLPRGRLLVALLLLASVVHLPWAVLFGRGAGIAEACGVVVVAVAIETAVFAGLRRRPLLVLGAGALAVLPVPSVVQLLAGGVLALLGVRAAWAVGPERGARAWRLTRPTRPVLALLAMFLLRIVRSARSRLTIASMLAALGGAGLLTLRTEPTAHPIPRALAIMSLPLTLAAALFVEPLLQCERVVRPILRTLRVRPLAIAAAFLVALAAPSTAFAASAGTAAGVLSGVEPFGLTFGLSVWAIQLSCLVGVWGRWHDRTRRRSPAVFAVGVALIAALAIGAMLAW